MRGIFTLLSLIYTFATADALILFTRKRYLEGVVKKYFDGVNKKDSAQIRSCFGKEAKIWDVVISKEKRTVPAEVLTDRCMDFLAAHPNCQVNFHYGPECGRKSNWVIAHWWEIGTWSGESCGLSPTYAPMACEGQSRFLVEGGKIRELVVTRTMTEWETAYIRMQRSDGS